MYIFDTSYLQTIRQLLFQQSSTHLFVKIECFLKIMQQLIAQFQFLYISDVVHSQLVHANSGVHVIQRA